MKEKMDLSGSWQLQLDAKKHLTYEEIVAIGYEEKMALPGTTSYAKKGPLNDAIELGHLTDVYKFEGNAWFSKEINIEKDLTSQLVYLFLERTRVTTLWIDGVKVGSQNSLSTPHRYEVSSLLTQGIHNITICVNNTNYPTKGGHLTSPDTQTNWNGITGKIELQIFERIHLENIRVTSLINKHVFQITGKVCGGQKGKIRISSKILKMQLEQPSMFFEFEDSQWLCHYELGESPCFWSDETPNLYELTIDLFVENELVDTYVTSVGLREFKAVGNKFTINGYKTFLRGKHDGLIFPLTGFAPTNVEDWLRIMSIAKEYGMNHYRFHTCCPPEAAFIAADQLGIYMQPELPFWGTITTEADEQHNATEQNYLIEEGFKMLEAYGNHPSFVMMSLGNELWGSQERINDILKLYKAFDNRPLYTQGSNNFQFCPVILENDDFFSGVRFSRERLIRGSYAMCDAPLGHIQTDRPSTMKDYDLAIRPQTTSTNELDTNATETSIDIQFGTSSKTVKLSKQEAELIPNIPVVTHEIGQFETYPNFDEIEKYTGPLKARNFEVFKARLEEKGLGDLAYRYFENSGKLAMSCYKEELEAVFRSRELAGFQLLDLQDFSGQGTALVGVLDAFMDSKGLITPKEWRSFCSDQVLMSRFEKYHYDSGEAFYATVELANFRNISPKTLESYTVKWQIEDCEKGRIFEQGLLTMTTSFIGEMQNNYIDFQPITCTLPTVSKMKKLTLSLRIIDSEVYKNYDFWMYPKQAQLDIKDLNIVNNLSKNTLDLLKNGENVVLFPVLSDLNNALQGFYCTDFWCYPMFRSISESVQREVPVGTMGLLVDYKHPSLALFPSEAHSTYAWWHIVEHSKVLILDGTTPKFRPIVQTIDNFERNHKLGILLEAKVLNGNLLICSVDFDKIKETVEGKQFLASIFSYVKSKLFLPKMSLTIEELMKIFA